MSSWRLTVDGGTPKTIQVVSPTQPCPPLGTGEVGLSNIVMHHSSGTGGNMTFEQHGDYAADLLFKYGNTVKLEEQVSGIWYTRWNGPSLDPERCEEPGKSFIRYKVATPWQNLQDTAFQQDHSYWNGSSQSFVKVSSSILCATKEGVKQTVLETLQEIATWAMSISGVGCAISVDAAITETIMFMQVGTVANSDAIQRMCRWIKDCVLWWDMSTVSPTLHISRASSLTPVTIDYVGTVTYGNGEPQRILQGFNLAELDSGVRSQVVLFFEYPDPVNSNYIRVVVQCYPPGSDGKAVRALVDTISMMGEERSYIECSCTVDTISYNDVVQTTRYNWWKARIKAIETDSGKGLTTEIVSLDTTRVWQDQPLVYPVATYKELTSGHVPDWLNKTVGEETFHCWAYVRNTDNGGNQSEGWQEVSLKLRVTNADGGDYSELTSFTSAEPIPAGLAQALYTQEATAAFSGNLRLAHPTGGYIGTGNLVNISNALADYATMNAVVQECSIEVREWGCLYNLTVGWPQQMGVNDLLDLMRRGRQRIVPMRYERENGATMYGKKKVTGKQQMAIPSTVFRPGGKLIFWSRLPTG